SINDLPNTSRRHRFYAADITTDLTEKLSTLQGCWRCSKHCVAWWNHCAAYELRKVVNICQAKAVRLIFRVRRGLEHSCNVLGAQPVSDAHLVEIRVGYKGEQTAVLVVAAEASGASLSRSLENRR